MTDTQPLSAEELENYLGWIRGTCIDAGKGCLPSTIDARSVLRLINQLIADRDEARAYVENTRADHHKLWLKDAEWAVSCGKLVMRAESAEADRDHWKERATMAEENCARWKQQADAKY